MADDDESIRCFFPGVVLLSWFLTIDALRGRRRAESCRRRRILHFAYDGAVGPRTEHFNDSVFIDVFYYDSAKCGTFRAAGNLSRKSGP